MEWIYCRPREMEWIHTLELERWSGYILQNQRDGVDTYCKNKEMEWIYCRTREMEWIHIVELERWSGYILWKKRDGVDTYFRTKEMEWIHIVKLK